MQSGATHVTDFEAARRGAVESWIACRSDSGRLIAMKSRTVGVVDDLERKVRKPAALGGIYRQKAKLVVGEPTVRVHSQHRQGTAHFDDSVQADLRQCPFEIFHVHAAVTSLRMLREPDRKPRRSIATRVKPAARIAAMIVRMGIGVSQSASISRESSTRASSP